MSAPHDALGSPGMRRLAVICRHAHRPATPALSALPQSVAATPALTRQLAASYDYVVVGAGSAGCVVASRLSEDPAVSVLLIEAGGSNQRFAVRSPFVTCPKLQNTDIDWAYRTTPQANVDDRVSHWPSGKCLGGSSSINYMLYVRGDPRNYDDWASRQGCVGWRYQDVLPYFKKSENLLGVAGETESRGVGGPLNVTDMNMCDWETRDVCERWVASCDAAGIPKTPDYNGPSQEGASLPQVTVRDGVRCDTASAFLFGTGALSRPNLTVVTNATVTRVAIHEGRATGVYVLRQGAASGPSLVSASREVVLCTGAVATPKLLMLSGVGPVAHLREHGIECVCDLPVGQNLQDHLMWGIGFHMKPGKTTGFSPGRPLTGGALPALFKHLLFGTGIFSFPWLQGTAFTHSNLPGSPEAEGNDMQLHFLAFIGGASQKDFTDNLGLEKRADRYYSDVNNYPNDGVTFLPTLLLPKSRGQIKLASTDPKDQPIIDPQYLTHPRDLDVCVELCRLVHRVAESPPLSEVLGDCMEDPTNPHPVGSTDYYREVVRRGAITVYHPVGTAKMGPDGDASAVVDLRLRVRGLRGLRVADASVMPTIVSGNTNAPSIMIGERAAAFLREDSAGL